MSDGRRDFGGTGKDWSPPIISHHGEPAMSLDDNFHTKVTVDEIVAVTDRAILINMDGEEKWLPKSCATDIPDIRRGDKNVEIKIVNWWLKKEGIL